MRVSETPTFDPAFRSQPGQPIVAVDENHQPVALAVHLSGTLEQRQSQARQFAAALHAHSDQTGKIATALSAGVDLAASLHPQFGPFAPGATSFIAFAATGFSFTDALYGKNTPAKWVLGFECGVNGLDLLVNTGALSFLGYDPALRTIALAGRVVSTIGEAWLPPSVGPTDITGN